jgi:trk system potassium uptake protein TrkA
MAKEKVFAVIGLGTFGKEVCEVLSSKGGSVIAIDNDPDLIQGIQDSVTQAIYLDSTDEEAMGEVPFEDVDIAIIAIGDNVEASIISTAICKKIGIPYIVARAVKDIHQQVLEQVGADEIINIEIEEGQRVAQRLIAPEVLDRIPISSTISVAEMYIPKEFIGKSLKDLDLRKKTNVNVVSIKRIFLSVDEDGNSIRREDIIFPEPEEVLKESDMMLVVGKNSDIERLQESQ